MEFTSLCLILSTLSVTPDRSQFFQYEDFSLKCVAPENCGKWTVRTNNSDSHCEARRLTECDVREAISWDSGVYWCESQTGCSNTVNITVAEIRSGGVILVSPALPVMEGENVTLQCVYQKRKEQPTSNFSAAFYRDTVFIGREPNGQMVLSKVSKSAEGSYKCEHVSMGRQSEQSWLAVKEIPKQHGDPPMTPAPPVLPLPRIICSSLLFLLYTGILILAIHVCRRWARARHDAKKNQKRRSHRIRPE